MPARLNSAAVMRFARNHCEKVAFGFVLLLVAGALGQTQWRVYSRQPAEITDRVTAAEAQLVSTAWPAVERREFHWGDKASPRAIVDQALRQPVSLASFLPSQRLAQRPGPGYWTLEEPKFLPVEDLIAMPGRALLRLAPIPVNHTAPEAVPDAPSQPLPDEFQRRHARNALTVTNTRAEGPQPMRTITADERPTVRGRAFPFVSVRGVLSARAQIRAYVDAIHKGYGDAAREFEIVDFHLERQRLLAGRDYWSEWRPVDVSVYYEVVSACDGLEPDVVSTDVTDSAITSPLPTRLSGRWNSLATHPRLENFELSDEELARELAYLKALAAQTQQSTRQPGLEKRGFTDLVRDAGDLADAYFGSAAPAVPARPTRSWQFGAAPQTTGTSYEDLVRRLAKEIDPHQSDKALQDWIRDRATAAGDLLLFRYLDFDVDPGETYRYRVQLEFRNPNYQRPLAMSGGAAHVVEGATRKGPWSDPTSPVAVEELTNSFLARMETPRGRIYPEALMEVFQYDQNTGTTVHQKLPVAFGQFIGGRAAAEIIDPVRTVVETRDFQFSSDDVLLDGLTDLSFPIKDHPDLTLARDSRGFLGVTEFAVMVDERQRLLTVDTRSQQGSLQRHEQRMRWQDEQFEHLRSSSPAIDGVPQEYQELYRQLYGLPPAGGPQTAPRRPANPLQSR